MWPNRTETDALPAAVAGPSSRKPYGHNASPADGARSHSELSAAFPTRRETSGDPCGNPGIFEPAGQTGP